MYEHVRIERALFILLRKFSYKCKSHKLLLKLSKLVISEIISRLEKKGTTS